MKTFYLNGQVFTGQLPLMQAFCVEDGRFLAVGTNEALSAQIQPQDRIVSLEGHFVCPGFVDSHMHLLNYGATLTQCDLTCCTNSLSALQKGLKDYIDRQQIPDGTWVRGRGWNQDYFAPASGIPTREDLDAVSTRHPICIVRCCGHCLVVNTKALELLQLDASLAQPEGGSFDLDNRGQMTGVFRDTAMSLIYTRLPAPNREEIKQMIRSAQKQFNTCGVTSCHSDDLCAFENVSWQEVIQAYQELEQAGELTIRVYEQSQFTSPQTLQTFFDAGYTTGTGSSLFRIGPLKMLGDGSLGARTAYLAGTYADAPGERGLAIFTQEEFDAMITLARKYRMQVAIHAIGDGILDRILLAYEKAFRQYPDNDHRCGIV
ncbi:MAG: amidohydrolase, partial [Oscillospiraceae bacterium]|nr:amidohydrolase [Oscillospiraceae bacterium]